MLARCQSIEHPAKREAMTARGRAMLAKQDALIAEMERDVARLDELARLNRQLHGIDRELNILVLRLALPERRAGGPRRHSRRRTVTSRCRARAPARPGEDPEPLDQALARAANRKEAA